MPSPLEKSCSIEYKGCQYEISTRYRQGSEDLLIFMHGLGCSKNNFMQGWRHRALEEFSLLAFDFIGFGASCR